MATKKQKRERAERRRNEFMAEIKRIGLLAQQKDRQLREARHNDTAGSATARLH